MTKDRTVLYTGQIVTSSLIMYEFQGDGFDLRIVANSCKDATKRLKEFGLTRQDKEENNGTRV